MSIGVLAMVGVSPERVASLSAAGYAVREGKKYASRIEAVREAGESVRAVLTNGRGGLSGDHAAHRRTRTGGTYRGDRVDSR